MLFSIFWPFAAFGFLQRRTTSPAPIISVVLTGGLTVGMLWVGLINTLRGMAITGGGRGATSAGIAEALMTPGWTLFSVAIIAFAALVLRHRPFLDRVTAALVAALIAEIAAALLFARMIAPSRMPLAIAGAISSLILTILAAVWLFLVVRGRVQPRPIRGGVAFFALAYVIMAVLVYQQARHYMFIAMHG